MGIGNILNNQQLQAVKHDKGPLLVIAGAGTGKTTVITERIKYLITKRKLNPSEILALTFTEKAAKEMQDRVDDSLPYGYSQMWISTFHSFCDRVLRSELLQIGLNPKFKLMTQAESVQLMRKNLFDFKLDYYRPLGNPNKFIEAMLQHFSRLQDEDITPTDYLQWVKKESAKKANDKLEIKKWRELAKAYKKYEEIKTEKDCFDYGDLIVKTLEIFRKRKNVLKEYKKKFSYILVDEFQDTNFSQNELIKLLVGNNGNVTVVADDDQCLPADSNISTPAGGIPIKKVKPGDDVITAVGKGYLSTSKVLYVNKTKKKARFITFTTESGKKLEVTDNHKMFCMTPNRKFETSGTFYVYLMFRSDLGWRIGITDDLSQRLKLERSADKILAIKSCNSLEEVRFYETVYSMRYQIPTYPFKPRKRMILTNDWLRRLFSEFDTLRGAERLSRDLKIDLNSHHFALGAVVRGSKERVKVILKMCSRRYSTKWARGRFMLSPKVLHQVSLETSSKRIKMLLNQSKITTYKTKKGWKVNKMFADLKDAGDFAKILADLTGGFLEVKFDIGKRNIYSRPSLIIPAGNIFTGMYLPVMKGHGVIYERVVKRVERIKTEIVYDLEIDKTHNFVADGVVVHNSIYRWRGAATSNVIQFRKSFPKTKIVTLKKNYRSSQEILDKAYSLIQYNNPDRLEVVEKINKKLISMTRNRKIDGEAIVGFIHEDRVENEADKVAKEITKLIENKDNKLNFKDFAILVRANNHAEPFTRALARHGIPYQFLGPGRLFKQPEIVDLISYLKVLNNFEDSLAMYRILSLEYLEISARDLSLLVNFAKRKNTSLFEVLENVDEAFVSSETKEKVGKLIRIINKHLKLIRKETAGQILFYFLQDLGVLAKLLNPDNPESERRASNISKFFDKLKTYEIDHEEAGVSAVVDWIDLAMEMGESPLAADSDWNDVDAVNIMTIHSAKGLEFPVVFLVNLVAQRFPTTERSEQIPIPESLIKEILPKGDYHLQEERRLFYVGMTRAKEKLYMTAADYYGEGKREKRLSPFVFETLGEEKKKREKSLSNEEQLSILNYQADKSNHPIPIHNTYKIDFLSYSQIETFRICPMHYKLRYIIKIPSPASASQSFGISIHSAIKSFYDLVKKSEKPTKKLILNCLTDNWAREGYLSKKHEDKFFDKGKLYLEGFLKEYFDPRNLPEVTELPFVIPLITDKKSIMDRPLKIGGKIDRVDVFKDGTIEIIDYKTGATIPTQRQVDKDLQLSFYALAASTLKEHPFVKTPDKIKLSLYYLDTQEKLSTQRTMEELEREKKYILKIRDEIEKSDFKCSGNFLCKSCEYKLLCNQD